MGIFVDSIDLGWYGIVQRNTFGHAKLNATLFYYGLLLLLNYKRVQIH